MTVTVAPATVDYGTISKQDIRARFHTAQATNSSGAYTYRRGGQYRLAVSMSSRCSWSMRLFI